MKLTILSEEENLAKQEALEKAKAQEAEKSKAETNSAVTVHEIDADFETGLTAIDVAEREDDLEQMTAEYILNLIDAEDIDAEELGLDSNELSSIIDEFEQILAVRGIQVYRPAFVEDDDGTIHIAYSRFDQELNYL